VRPRSALFPDQQEAASVLATRRLQALFNEPGRGKTATILTALHDLGRPRALVLAPARVADTVWAPEAALWEHLADMPVAHATGDSFQRVRAMTDRTNRVVTLSYENFPWLLSVLDVRKFFDAIVFDELSRMKNVDTVKFKRFRSAVRDLAIRFGMTGTPVGNHLIDIWGEMYMVAGDKPLGPTKGEFVSRYFAPAAKLNGRVISWKPHGYAQAEIERRIKPYAFTQKPTVSMGTELRVNPIHVTLPPLVEEMSDALADELHAQLESGTTLEAFSKATATVKVRQICGGAVYVETPTELGEAPPRVKKWEFVHGMKIQALEELVGELQGEPLLVFYWFQHEKERILAHFKGKAVELDSSERIKSWNRKEIEILLAHPASAGHGLNLQHGGHNICWFTLPYSLEMWKQANGREVRHGQKSPWVTAHILMAGKSDAYVLGLLHRKAAVEDALLAAVLR
jgi:SNF2 family DNA or RNA helicase